MARVSEEDKRLKKILRELKFEYKEDDDEENLEVVMYLLGDISLLKNLIYNRQSIYVGQVLMDFSYFTYHELGRLLDEIEFRFRN